MGLIGVVAGLILIYAGPWFEDQVVVGQVLVVAGVALTIIQYLIWLWSKRQINNFHSNFFDRKL